MQDEFTASILQGSLDECNLMLLRRGLAMADFDFKVEKSFSSSFFYVLNICARRTDRAQSYGLYEVSGWISPFERHLDGNLFRLEDNQYQN